MVRILISKINYIGSSPIPFAFEEYFALIYDLYQQ